MKKQRAIEIFKNAAQQKILVIGDIILDHYVYGTVDRISPEAPVPVLNVTHEFYAGGGAANVALNLVSLGFQVYLQGVIGQDAAGERLCQLLIDQKIATNLIATDPSRPTTRKSRFIAHHQQVVRVDQEQTHPISPDIQDHNYKQLGEMTGEFDAVIYQDYDKGVLSTPFIKKTLPLFSEIITTVDPKYDHFFDFTGATLFKPNLRELRHALGAPAKAITDPTELGRMVLPQLACQALLLTRSEDGMSLFEKDGTVTHIPTKAKEVYDVSGAGDTVIAVVTAALAGDSSMKEAAVLANYAAGVVVAELGVVPIRYQQLIDSLPEEI